MKQPSNHFWTQSYPEGIPAEIFTEGIHSINSLFEDCCAKYERNAAFTCMGSSMTYGELDVASRAFGAYLRSVAGLQVGDRVALMMPNLLQYPVALFGILRAGLIAVNVNPLYTPRELEHQLSDSGAKAIVIVENFAKTLESVSAQFPHLLAITTQVGDLLPAPKRWLVNAIAKHVKKMVPPFSLPKRISFMDALDAGIGKTLPAHRSELEDIAFLQYTGGTTGVAKGAMLTHGNVVSNLLQSGAWISKSFKEGSEVAISPLPLYHIFCLTSTLCFMTWGARNVLIPNPRDLKGLAKTMRQEHWTILTGVNTLFNGLLHTTGFERIDFSRAKICLGGGAPVQRAVAHAWRGATGIEITEAYGLTETSPGVSINPIGAPFTGSIGLPLPSTEISIRSPSFKELGPWSGEGSQEDFTGEICVRGPQVMKGYWQRPEDTAACIRDGWLMTGDIGHMDAKGFAYITDRKKDMILVSGFNVYPNEIEDVLASCPGLLEAAAVGVKDSKSGEAVKVFIVRKNPNLTEADVIAYCKSRLTAYKIPRQVEFRDSLPKSPVGKILRRELRDAPR